MDVSIVLLAYNEEENLRVLLPSIISNIEQVTKNYEILVIDTMTPLDNTEEVCLAHSARYINQKEPGFAGAFRTAIAEAQLESFLIMDSDGSHDPCHIPAIYRLYETGADVVIGSRYVPGGHTDDTWVSIAMSKVLNAMFRFCLGIKAKDISTDYRMYSTQALKEVKLECKNYDVLQEVLMKLKVNKPGLVIKETPIQFSKRLSGESKRRLLPFIISYIKTLVRLTCVRITFGFRNKK